MQTSRTFVSKRSLGRSVKSCLDVMRGLKSRDRASIGPAGKAIRRDRRLHADTDQRRVDLVDEGTHEQTRGVRHHDRGRDGLGPSQLANLSVDLEDLSRIGRFEHRFFQLVSRQLPARFGRRDARLGDSGFVRPGGGREQLATSAGRIQMGLCTGEMHGFVVGFLLRDGARFAEAYDAVLLLLCAFELRKPCAIIGFDLVALFLTGAILQVAAIGLRRLPTQPLPRPVRATATCRPEPAVPRRSKPVDLR